MRLGSGARTNRNGGAFGAKFPYRVMLSPFVDATTRSAQEAVPVWQAIRQVLARQAVVCVSISKHTYRDRQFMAVTIE